MKKVLKLLLVGLAVITLAACTDYNGNNPVYGTDTLAEQNSSPICLDTASYLFERLEAILDADDGNLWGVNLHGPVVIADAITRYAIANMPDVDGKIFTRQGNFYVGKIPEEALIGNTASFFGGRRWGMVTWGLIEADNEMDIVYVMLHELFHAQQPVIFGDDIPSQGIQAHIRELDNRISIRLERNALFVALHATGEERMSAVHDALSIRAERRRLNTYSSFLAENFGFESDAAHDEIRFELVEGTALYTEIVLGRNNLEDRLALLEKFIDMNGDDTVIQYGYHTGALYGLLLDEFSINWREGINWHTDLAVILKKGINFETIIPFNEINLERYGYSEIRIFEEAFVAEVERLTNEAREALSGSLLFIDALGEFGQGADEDVTVLFVQGLGVKNSDEFDYDNDEVFLLVDGRNYERTVFYGDFSYSAEFGEVEFTSGFLMLWRAMWRHGIPADNIEVDGNRIIGSNWVLTLNEGFEMREVDGGHFGIVDNR